MFTPEELSAFLELVHKFSLRTGLSDAAIARLFGVSHASVHRWSHIRRKGGDKSIVRRTGESVMDRINYLNDLHNHSRLYAAIAQETAAERESILRRELDRRAA